MLYESSLLAVELSAKTSANAKGWARLPAVRWLAFGPVGRVERGRPDAGARFALGLKQRVDLLLGERMPLDRHLVVRPGRVVSDVAVRGGAAAAQPGRREDGREQDRQSPDEASW